MSRTLEVAPHLSRSALAERYRRCRVVGERERLHCVLLKMEGRTSKEIAAFFMKREDWVRRTVRRYNRDGPDSMKDGRRRNGAKLLLTDADMAALDAALAHDPPDGGLWSGPKVASWITDRTGVEVTNYTGWKYLKRLGYSIQRPRPKHPDADKEAQEAFKKGGSSGRFVALLEPIPTR